MIGEGKSQPLGTPVDGVGGKAARTAEARPPEPAERGRPEAEKRERSYKEAPRISHLSLSSVSSLPQRPLGGSKEEQGRAGRTSADDEVVVLVALGRLFGDRRHLEERGVEGAGGGDLEQQTGMRTDGQSVGEMTAGEGGRNEGRARAQSARAGGQIPQVARIETNLVATVLEGER
jgi:hypothetical protein